MPHPGFLIGHIESLTIRAAISSYTLLSLGFFPCFFPPSASFLLSLLHSPPVSMLSMNLHPSFSQQPAFFFYSFWLSFFFMISETAGLGGLLRQLSDHQDLTVEEECQRRLRVQCVWPLSEAALGKGELRKHQCKGRRERLAGPPTNRRNRVQNERRGDSVVALV